jgi:hypothetical protein
MAQRLCPFHFIKFSEDIRRTQDISWAATVPPIVSGLS